MTEPDLESLRSLGASVVLDEQGDGRPVVSPPAGGALLARVPAEMARMRAEDPGLAREWRAASRDALGSAFNQGFVATGMTRSGWYVLERPGGMGR